jgi:hypothetical protein
MQWSLLRRVLRSLDGVAKLYRVNKISFTLSILFNNYSNTAHKPNIILRSTSYCRLRSARVRAPK